MSDDSVAVAFFLQICRYGKIILEVEKQALESSLRSLFNKRNHADFIAILGQQIVDLQAIAADMQQHSATVTHAVGLHRMIQELVGLATALSAVCAGLNDKAQGRPYSTTQYRSDLNMVAIKRAACELAQTRAFD